MSKDRDLAAAGSIVRSRCTELGLPMWRFDREGEEIEAPDYPGLAGLWLSCQALSCELSKAVASWKGTDQPPPIEILGGCVVIGLPDMRRRRCVGYSVALAISPASLESACFRALCSTTNLDPNATRQALLPLAHLDAASASTVHRLLQWAVSDQTELGEARGALGGFTNQLTDCFETIDLLYKLGRSMNDITRPEQFITKACDLLTNATRFTIVAAQLSGDGRRGVSNSDQGDHEPILISTKPNADSLLAAALKSLEIAAATGTPGPVILNEVQIPGLGAMQALALPIFCKGKPAGHLVATGKGGDDPQVSSYDSQLFEATASYIGAFLDNSSSYRTQRALFLGTIEALAAAIDAKDSYTCGHSRRVAMLSMSIAQAAGMPPDQAERVRIAGLVHDVGKIGVPEAVLCKPGRLTDDEFAQIKKHPEIGHRILKDLPSLEDVLPGVLHHHERIDGRGYPHGLAGDAIPLLARIIGVADTFDAMSSNRAYRPAMPREKVLAELQRSAGSQLDAEMVRAFLTLDLTEYDRMVAESAAQAVAAESQPRLAA
jgi:HD-GYP domain-containing protein (c-di-GMP phosphodiesterase class II)